MVEGEVELLLQERTAPGSLARLGAGATFGAESVVGKEAGAVDAAPPPMSARCRPLGRRWRRHFPFRLPAAEAPGGIARNRHEATDDALDLRKGTEIIIRLVQGDDDRNEPIAISARMRAVKGRIENLSRTSCRSWLPAHPVPADDGRATIHEGWRGDRGR